MKFYQALGSLALMISAAAAHSQTWVKVADEGDTVVATSTITYRFGTPANVTPAVTGATMCTTPGGCWDAPVTGSGNIAVTGSTFGGIDPAYGTVKMLQVLETSSAQTVVDITSSGTSNTVSIPALVALNQFAFSVNVNGYTINCSLGPATDGSMTNVSCAVAQPTTGTVSTTN